MKRTLALPITALALLFGLAACAAPNAAAAPVADTSNAIVLDVRTPEEFAAGHLEGAQSLDFNGGEVAAAIPTLDPEAEYLVYCRSGNRSGQAIALMRQAGFTNLTNLGSLEEAASSTGLTIVQ